jgi:hypothetical protein
MYRAIMASYIAGQAIHARGGFPLVKPTGLALDSFPMKVFSFLATSVFTVLDPPNDQRRMRNNQIETFEGVRNRFIDDPAMADQLQ